MSSVDITAFSQAGIDAKHSGSDASQRNFKIGWKDLKADFGIAQSGAGATTVDTLANGLKVRNFGVGDSIFATYHVGHDYVEGTKAFPHIHFMSDTSILSGQTVTWEFIYTLAKGHQQNESLTGARSTISMTFTAPRNMDAGEHIVLEGTNDVTQAFLLLEPDTLIAGEWKRVAGTFGGNVYGLKGDLHYQSDHESTNNRKPDFDGAVV